MRLSFYEVPFCFCYKVHQYMSALPEAKVPYAGGSAGEKYRVAQLLRQLPPHDSEARYCSRLSEGERRELRLFSARRRAEALGRGSVSSLPEPLKGTPCQQVDLLFSGDFVVLQYKRFFSFKSVAIVIVRFRYAKYIFDFFFFK